MAVARHLYFGTAARRGRMDPLIAVVLLLTGFALLLHHGWKHHFEEGPSHAREESCVWVCYFQPKDISHFETWAVICLTNAFWCVADSEIDERRAMLAGFFFAAGMLLLLLSCVWCTDSHPAFGCVLQNLRNHETWILVCFTGAVNILWLS